jgi:biotin carboxyl carrier protein
VVAGAIAAVAAMAPRGHVATVHGAAVWKAVATQTAPAGAAEPTAAPTPAFASFRGMKLLLPVRPADITAVVFHQSSYNDSYQMKPLIAIRSAASAKAAVDAQRAGGPAAWPRAQSDEDAGGVWTGSGLQLWRSGVGGRTDSAFDCGAKPGTPVIAPVTGTVMRIRPYKLYGRVDDFEFHLRPDGFNDVDVVVLHVTNPCVAEGDRVVAGVTQIAQVRKLTGLISGLQLRSYTVEGGDHTHVQVNKVPKPNETWVVGQDPPGLVRKGD